MIVTDNRVAIFVSERLGYALCPPYSCAGIERDGELIAGVIFNNWEGADIHVTAAGSMWTKEFMQAIGEYVFDQLGCQRMTFITEKKAVGRLAEKLGAKKEGRLRNHFGANRDGLLFGCLRDEYRYLPKR